jgi:hypothetical protein
LLFDGYIENRDTPRREFPLIRHCPRSKRFKFVCWTCELGFKDVSRASALYNKRGVLVAVVHDGCARSCHEGLRTVPLAKVLADLLTPNAPSGDEEI